MSKPIARRYLKDPSGNCFWLKDGQRKNWSVPEKLYVEPLERKDIAGNCMGYVIHDGKPTGSHQFYGGLKKVTRYDNFFYGDWKVYIPEKDCNLSALFVVQKVNDTEIIIYTWAGQLPRCLGVRIRKVNDFIEKLLNPKPKGEPRTRRPVFTRKAFRLIE